MQSKNKSLRQRSLAVIAMIVAAALMLSLLTFVSFGTNGTVTEAGAVDTVEETSVTNGEFTDTSGSDTLMTPSSWTGAAAEGTSENGIISGTVDLSTAAFDESALEELGLENEATIRTPFGSNSADNKFAGSNANALFINSDGSKVVYSYDSTSISLSANSYYEISAWVRTGSFGSDQGASIKISGMENDIIIEDIDTVAYISEHLSESVEDVQNSRDRDYGWVEYKFYIATSTMSAPSVTISLQLGSSISRNDGDSDEARPITDESNGWVLFDHVTAKQYTYNTFMSRVEDINNTKTFVDPSADRTYSVSDDGTALYYSENDSSFLSVADDGSILSEGDAGYEDGIVGNFENNTAKWTSAPQSYGNAKVSVGAYNSVNEDLGIDFESDIPYSPDGETGNILMINSFDGNIFRSASVGYKSVDFTIERRTNYRLSVWVKTVGDSIAGAAVSGMDYRGPLDEPNDHVNNGKGQLMVTATELGGDDANTMRYGWSEQVFYIRGSDYADYDISLELWLGMRATSDASTVREAGIAMFDSVRIEEITYSEYSSNSSSGTTVTFDADAESGTITNGNFADIESIEYDANGNAITPYTPADWTLMAAGEDETTGMSTSVYDENYRDYVVSGTISSDMTSYNYKIPGTSNSYITGSVSPALPTDMPANLLMIKADADKLPADKTGVAVGYRSTSFSASANTVQRIDITMRVEDIGGYGANLVLKSGDKEVATIQRITDTYRSELSAYAGTGYTTFSFYIQTGESSLSELYVEIWLGMYDDDRNVSKLSTGTVYVSEVSMTQLNTMTTNDDGTEVADSASLSSERSAFATRLSEYKAAINAGVVPDYACYSTYGSGIDSYNIYDDGYLKTPYNWTQATVTSNAPTSEDAVSFGSYDMNTGADRSVLPENYTEEGATADDSLVIKNKVAAYSRYTRDITYTLDGGSYYRLTVLMQVYIPTSQPHSDYMGAYIGIDGTDYGITDISGTSDDSGKLVFREFSLYIHTDGTAPSDSESEDDSTTDESTTRTITLALGIGGEALTQRAVGTLIINDIELTAIDSATFDEANDAIQASGSVANRYIGIADYTEGETSSDTEDDSTDNTTTDASGNNWYIYISVVLAVVIVIAVIAALVRYMAIRRKRSGERSPAETTSYDRNITLLRQHNARNESDTEEVLEGYDAFDEDIEDRIETMRAIEEARALAEESESEGSEEVPSEEETETSADGDQSESAPVTEMTEDASAETAAEEEESSPAPVTETATETTDELPAEEVPAVPEATETPAETTPASEDDASDADEDEDYSYSDEIVDFTPSEERRRALEEAKAEKARKKAEKEAARKAEEDARARLEAERREATRRYNKWDDFED